MNFDLVVFTIATGLNAEMAINTVRIPTYEAFARHFQGRGKVLVVTDCVTTFPEFLALFAHPSHLFRRIRKFGVNRRFDNLFTYTPLLPLPLSVWERLPAVLGRVVMRIHGWCLRSVLRRIGVDNSCRVVSVNDPRLHFVPGLVDESLLVYDCLDDYSLYGWETNPAKVLGRERKLLREADIVLTTSRAIYDKMRTQHEHVYYFPNAVDFEFFNRATHDSTPISPVLARIPRPIVGFMGCLTTWYDFALLRSIIQARSHWSFVFIGWADISPEIECIKQMPNAYFLGTREFQELPSFLKGFDAVVMPYSLNDSAKSVNPDKMYQYMAAGVPVVSTPIPEVTQYSEVIELASDVEGFIQALETCIFQNNQERIMRQISIASNETWDKRVTQQVEIFQNFLKQT